MKNVLTILCLAVMIPSGILAQRDYFKAVNDTVNLYPGVPVTIDLMANDIFSPQDSVYVTTSRLPSGFSLFVRVYDSPGTPQIKTYLAQPGLPGSADGLYYLRKPSTTILDTSRAIIHFIVHDESFDSLCINNINARFNSWGSHFMDKTSSSARFEVPKFSGKHTLFLNTFWIGGMDDDSLLYVAGQLFGQGAGGGPAWTKNEFYAGPVMDSLSYSSHTDSAWSYIWNLKQDELAYHRVHWKDPDYIPIHDILTWPGNGDTTLGQAANLAPYEDVDGNGRYNPFAGDCPLIRGDQCLYFIFNDDRYMHLETQGPKMRVEVHGMAYAFDLPADSAFNNTVFLNYRIFNRSGHRYYKTFVGSYTDFDIGYSYDDFVQCDVGRSSYYAFNGRPVDGTGQSWAYGAYPPAQAVTILSGPLMDADGLDNPSKDNYGNQQCNQSINGNGFGDTIIDNEHLGLTVLMAKQKPNPLGFGLTWFDYVCYNYMQAKYWDSTQMEYGGSGYPAVGSYGPACRFHFPGMSDPLNWGVGCQSPNGPQNWTEETSGNAPGDRSGMGSMGPFTFNPGDVQEIDLAFTCARDYNDSTTRSVPLLMQYVDSIRHAFATNTLPGGGSFNGVSEQKQPATGTIRIYPNPASGHLTVALPKALFETVNVTICDNGGREVYTRQVNPAGNKIRLDLPGLKTGLYFIRVQSPSVSGSAKVSIVK